MMLVTQSETMSVNVTSLGLNPAGASSVPAGGPGGGSDTALRRGRRAGARVRRVGRQKQAHARFIRRPAAVRKCGSGAAPHRDICAAPRRGTPTKIGCVVRAALRAAAALIGERCTARAAAHCCAGAPHARVLAARSATGRHASGAMRLKRRSGAAREQVVRRHISVALFAAGTTPPCTLSVRMASASALGLLLEGGDAAALAAVLSALPAVDLARACCVCRALRAAGSAAPLWASACAVDWASRSYIAPGARALLGAGEARAAFALARADATRDALSDDELTSLPWRFHFKAEAGPEWVRRDPYWRVDGGAASHIVFTRDGKLRRTPPPGEDLTPWPEVAITWRWARFGAGRTGDEGAPVGSLLRCHVEEAPVPTYAVRRHLLHWGWIMESCWGVYTSYEPPRPDDEAFAADEALLTVTSAVQFREANAYNVGCPLDEDDVADTDIGQQLVAALASSKRLQDRAVMLRSAAAAKAREWRAAPGRLAEDDLVYIGAVAMGHADRGDGGRVSHVLLPRLCIRGFMCGIGVGVPAAGVAGVLDDEDWGGSSEHDSED
jgi:hypothetical protein